MSLFFFFFLSMLQVQYRAWTYDPEIRSDMLNQFKPARHPNLPFVVDPEAT